MKKTFTITALAVLLALTVWKCSVPHADAKGVKLPQDVLASCTVTPDTFKTWFANGNITENGVVTPANSVTFRHRNNCDFYQWSERMFLWITSPLNGKPVLNSPLFYTVSPDSAGKRTLIPNSAGGLLEMSGHITKLGPNRLPVIKDKTGKLFEVEAPEPGTHIQEVVKDETGKLVEVDHIKQDAKGAMLFIDKSGKTIANPHAVIAHQFSQKRIVHRFRAGHQFVFLDADGHQIESEEGQATGDVLMSQNHSLVYYLLQVNDVYAYYMSMVNNPAFKKNSQLSQFPTDSAQLKLICNFARKNNATLPDSNALAIEIKSSWVEAKSLGADVKNYVTVMADIPVYDTTSSILWIPKSHKKALMALVGMHIVGSVAGHPEMVWATFEQQNNTPNAAYSYIDKNNKTKPFRRMWAIHGSFNKDAASDSVNISNMTVYRNDSSFVSTDTIRAFAGHTISPSNTRLSLPWGSAADSLTNPENGSSAASNSEVISINNSIRSMLVNQDVRKNYILIGAVWTSGGAAPTGISYGADKSPGVTIGTSVLANSTMETYFQAASNSCFTCHSGGSSNPNLSPNTLSHIFAALLPLNSKAIVKKK